MEKDYISLRRWAKYGRLLSGLIHNLNTPLMGISGWAEIISMAHPDLKGPDQILEQVDRVNDMLTKLSELYRLEDDDNINLVDMCAFLREMDIFYHADMKYKHKLNVTINMPASLPLRTRPARLTTAVAELWQNAVEASEDGGALDITLAETPDGCKITITNQTVGNIIPKAPFTEQYTGNPTKAGMGLYLANSFLQTIAGELALSQNDGFVTAEVYLKNLEGN